MAVPHSTGGLPAGLAGYGLMGLPLATVLPRIIPALAMSAMLVLSYLNIRTIDRG